MRTFGAAIRLGSDSDSKRPQGDVVTAVAREYDIPTSAVEAAILYDHVHRGAIDTVLAEIEAART